jgi:ribosomal 50S subunit-recycling heat shock protein
MDAVRVDVWVWSVRLYKSRSQATTGAKAGHVRINGVRAKPSQPVKVGDEVRVFTDREHIVRWAISTRRKYRERVPRLEGEHPHLVVVRLRSQREVEQWLGGALRDAVR